jgi:ABC-type thiamine transport system ATPase subunit
MNDVNIQFNQDQKSFPANQTFQFYGNFIGITGENGSGKSQLLYLTAGLDSSNQSISYNTTQSNVLIINGDIVNLDDILYFSFKTMHLNNISRATYGSLEQNNNLLYHVYQGGNIQDDQRMLHKHLHDLFKNKLGEHYIHQITDINSFLEHLPKYTFFDSKNIFTTDIHSRFYKYARDVRNFKLQEFDKNSVKGDDFRDQVIKQFKIAPWSFFNELFIKINFEYRFLNDYEINQNEAIEDISLIHTITNEKRLLSELSDGEIAIFSLFVAFLRTEYDDYKIKVLLLDEYDAPLNPILIKQYLTLLNEYFCKKDVTVIITTHSVNTIALIPEENIYWMFKKSNQTNERYEKINRMDAVARLCVGVSNFRIDIDKRRTIFCEDENDKKFYSECHKALEENNLLKLDLELNFECVTKIHQPSDQHSGSGGCDKVISVVQLLNQGGNDKIIGVLDWDGTKTPITNILIHGENTRYTLENYLFEPIYLIDLFEASGVVSLNSLNLNETTRRQITPKIAQETYNRFFDDWVSYLNKEGVVTNTLSLTKQPQNYVDGSRLELPEWFIKTKGHDIFEKYIKPIINVNKIKKIPKFQSNENFETAINQYLLDQVVKNAYFISQDTVNLFKLVK